MKSLKTYITLFLFLISFSLFGQQNTFEWSDTHFEVGAKRTIHLYFSCSREIASDTQPAIDTLVTFLNKNPQLKVEIGVHSDSRGTDRYNYQLSKRRAKAIFDQLVTEGISIRQVDYKGYGETKKIIQSPSSEKEHQRNRRIEIVIVDNQLPFYVEELEKDSVAQAHYLEQLDYFELQLLNFEEEFDSLASYFKKVLEEDSTRFLVIENPTDVRESNDYRDYFSRQTSRYLFQKYQIDMNKVKLDGFYAGKKMYIADTKGKILFRFISKSAYENHQENLKIIRLTDKYEGCPF